MGNNHSHKDHGQLARRKAETLQRQHEQFSAPRPPSYDSYGPVGPGDRGQVPWTGANNVLVDGVLLPEIPPLVDAMRGHSHYVSPTAPPLVDGYRGQSHYVSPAPYEALPLGPPVRESYRVEAPPPVVHAPRPLGGPMMKPGMVPQYNGSGRFPLPSYSIPYTTPAPAMPSYISAPMLPTPAPAIPSYIAAPTLPTPVPAIPSYVPAPTLTTPTVTMAPQYLPTPPVTSYIAPASSYVAPPVMPTYTAPAVSYISASPTSSYVPPVTVRPTFPASNYVAAPLLTSSSYSSPVHTMRDDRLQADLPISRAGRDRVVGEHEISRDELMANGNLLEEPSVGRSRAYPSASYSGGYEPRYESYYNDRIGYGDYREPAYSAYDRSSYGEPLHAGNAEVGRDYNPRYGRDMPSGYTGEGRFVGVF